MSHRLENKVVLITGAGSGMGKETAATAAEEGPSLALVDINEPSLEETKTYCHYHRNDAEIITITADISQENDGNNYQDFAFDALKSPSNHLRPAEIIFSTKREHFLHYGKRISA